MKISIFRSLFFAVIIAGLFLLGVSLASARVGAVNPRPDPKVQPEAPANPLQTSSTPIFRFPVVPGSTLSGYFDHNQGNDLVTFYDGRRNPSTRDGFIFTCAGVGMYDFVGCQDSVSGEGACSNSRELWYDGHRGIDMEYSPNWHTGAFCDPGRFAGITNAVYAPAAGKVHFAGYDPYRPGNGWHIRLKHDLNGNGNYEDDNFRSIYLHFTANALAVSTGQIVAEGQYLGLGGSTGYSSSPHLHFEVQRSSDYFRSTYWSVDPYGWQGEGEDPWPYENVLLWRNPDPDPDPDPDPNPVPLDYHHQLPMVWRVDPQPCTSCECMPCDGLVRNGGFEEGGQAWVENGVDIVAREGQGSLKISPNTGSWLGWLGGRNSAVDQLYQVFTLPTGQTELELTYFLRVDTRETGGVYDLLQVRLRDESGGLVQELDTVSNDFSPSGQWSQRVVKMQDLGALAGQALRLSFEARTDNNAVTSFYIDDITLISR